MVALSIQLLDGPFSGVPGPLSFDLPQPVHHGDDAAAEQSAITVATGLSQNCGYTFGSLRLVPSLPSDDLAELGPHNRPGRVPGELEETPDVEYDASMWTDTEHEGFGAPDRRAP